MGLGRISQLLISDQFRIRPLPQQFDREQSTTTRPKPFRANEDAAVIRIQSDRSARSQKIEELVDTVRSYQDVKGARLNKLKTRLQEAGGFEIASRAKQSKDETSVSQKPVDALGVPGTPKSKPDGVIPDIAGDPVIPTPDEPDQLIGNLPVEEQGQYLGPPVEFSGVLPVEEQGTVQPSPESVLRGSIDSRKSLSRYLNPQEEQGNERLIERHYDPSQKNYELERGNAHLIETIY